MISNLTVKVGADIDGLQKELQKASSQLGGFGKSMKMAGGLIAGAFAAGKIIDFGKEVFNVTAEFQKFEAVLTNTLGHNGAANAALTQITDFAAKTPYQVNELTASFVKLANQGFVPTLKEMTSLGDLASAMGKSFDMLTEAIIDAQTGEFERLKEFGIRASKQGDKVTFTFKGVKKQVDFTADSIREYVLSLGDIQGVTGGMEAQSKTLGGGLSNLADSWEQLTLAIGKAAESGGLFSKTLDLIAAGVKGLKGLFEIGESKEELLATIQFFQEARRQAAMSGDMDTWARANDALQAATTKLRDMVEGEKKLAEIQNNEATPAVKAQTESVKDLVAEWDRLNHVQTSSVKPTTGKDGGTFGLDTGMFADQATRYAAIGQRIIATNNDIKVSGDNMALATNDWAQVWVDWADVAAGGIADLAASLGRASVGVGNFGEDILKMVGGFATQLGEALIAAGTSVMIAKSSLLTNPAAAIAAGAVLVAAGAALNASISKSVDSLGSSAGSSSRSAGTRSNVGSLGSSGLEITLGGEWRIQGPDLVYIFNRQNQLNNRSRG